MARILLGTTTRFHRHLPQTHPMSLEIYFIKRVDKGQIATVKDLES